MAELFNARPAESIYSTIHRAIEHSRQNGFVELGIAHSALPNGVIVSGHSDYEDVKISVDRTMSARDVESNFSNVPEEKIMAGCRNLDKPVVEYYGCAPLSSNRFAEAIYLSEKLEKTIAIPSSSSAIGTLYVTNKTTEEDLEIEYDKRKSASAVSACPPMKDFENYRMPSLNEGLVYKFDAEVLTNDGKLLKETRIGALADYLNNKLTQKDNLTVLIGENSISLDKHHSSNDICSLLQSAFKELMPPTNDIKSSHEPKQHQPAAAQGHGHP